MMRTMASAFIAGLIGAAFGALLETLWGPSGAALPAFVAAFGLLAPVGLGVGLGLVVLRALLPEESRPRAIAASLARKSDPALSARILATALFGLAGLALGYRIAFFFLTRFHHHGLAGLAFGIAATAFLAIWILLAQRASRLLARVLEKAPAFARRPASALAVAILFVAVALVLPIAAGPSAKGVFGFMGFFRKEGLGLGPLASLGLIALVASIALLPLLARRRRVALFSATLCLALGVSGPFVAHAVIAAKPFALERIDSAGGASRLVALALRRLADGDRDGHSRILGARDCDDGDAAVHPGAAEIPDNGVDEDCDGRDLQLSAIAIEAEKEKAAEASAAKKLVRPAFPDDVSLVLITIDSFRYDGAGFMGYDRGTTPNLDAFFANGTVYERAYGLGSYTGQAVPPMMTGKYASELLRNDKHEMRVSGRETFAAEVVCGQSVRCGGILSHFLFEPHYGWNQGFDTWETVAAEPPGPGHIDSKFNSHFVASRAIRWLSDPKNTSGRFWLWAHFMDPHKEYLEHEGFKKFGDGPRDMYDQELLFTDNHVGRLLDAIAKSPAAARTIVIVTADHGEAFGEHGLRCHGKELWEEVIRVPLAVAGPGIAKKRIARQTSLIDLFPTILDLFGAPIPEGIHGRSLVRDWAKGQELDERPVLADQPKNPYYETRRAFIDEGYKLHVLPDTGAYRLYKLTEDYERGDSLVESDPAAFAKIKAAYEKYTALELKPVAPVEYGSGSVDEMPLPEGVAP